MSSFKNKQKEILKMKTLSIKELQFYGEILFGEYWHKPFTEAIGVTEKQLMKWLSHDVNEIAIPTFVNDEIKKLLKWKFYETKESLKILNTAKDVHDFCTVCQLVKYEYAPYIPKEVTFEIIKHLVAMQEKYILDSIKYRIANYNPFTLDEAREFAADCMEGEEDIAELVEKAIEDGKTTLIGVDENGSQLIVEDIRMYKNERLGVLQYDEIEEIYSRIPEEHKKECGIFEEENSSDD